MRLDELSSLVRLGRLTKVFVLDEFNRRRKFFWPSSSQTDYASFMVRPVFYTLH